MKTSVHNTTTFQPELRAMTIKAGGRLVKDINDYLIQTHKLRWQGEDENDEKTIIDGTTDSNNGSD